jgi:hypothetical protein
VLAVIGTVWVVVGMAIYASWCPMMDAISPFLMMPLIGIHGAIGLFGVCVELARMVERRRASITPFWAGAAFLILTSSSLSWIGIAAVFAMERPDYDRVVAAARSGAAAEAFTTLRKVEFDEGPPLRIGFVWGGLLDNWNGIVWDPTGRVGLAQGWAAEPGRFTAPDDVRKIFGGDLLMCQALWDDYFHCVFT